MTSVRIFKNLFIITLNTLIIFLLANITFMYFSPILIKNLPHDFVKHISSCYRTFYSENLSSFDKMDHAHLFFGDSYIEGMGDEFLNGDSNYGFLNKFSTNKFFIVFGRSGFGTISNYQEYKLCNKLINNFTIFEYSPQQLISINFVFYEGNDLLDNLSEMEFGPKHSRNFLHNLRFFIPFVDYIRSKAKRTFKRIFEKEAKNINVKTIVTKNKFIIDEYLQHPSLELNSSDFNKGLNIFRKYINKIDKEFKSFKGEKRILYIPAPASIYTFKESEIPVRSYFDPPSFKVNTNLIKKRHSMTKSSIFKISENLGWLVCDVTPYLIEQKHRGFPSHGPRDWAHFNKTGYKMAKKAYKDCFKV